MIPVGGHNRVTLSSLLAWHLGRLIDFTDNEFCGLEPQPQNATKAHVSTTIHHTLRLRLAKTTACVSLAVFLKMLADVRELCAIPRRARKFRTLVQRWVRVAL